MIKIISLPEPYAQLAIRGLHPIIYGPRPIAAGTYFVHVDGCNSFEAEKWSAFLQRHKFVTCKDKRINEQGRIIGTVTVTDANEMLSHRSYYEITEKTVFGDDEDRWMNPSPRDLIDTYKLHLPSFMGPSNNVYVAGYAPLRYVSKGTFKQDPSEDATYIGFYPQAKVWETKFGIGDVIRRKSDGSITEVLTTENDRHGFFVLGRTRPELMFSEDAEFQFRMDEEYRTKRIKDLEEYTWITEQDPLFVHEAQLTLTNWRRNQCES